MITGQERVFGPQSRSRQRHTLGLASKQLEAEIEERGQTYLEAVKSIIAGCQYVFREGV
jgi:hypothetical protein